MDVKIGNLVALKSQKYHDTRSCVYYKVVAIDREMEKITIARIEHSDFFKAMLSIAQDTILRHCYTEIQSAVFNVIRRQFGVTDDNFNAFIYTEKEQYNMNPQDIIVIGTF
jgi:hypothetical protein